MLASGTTIAGYRIDRFVAQGGMGVVYAATQLALERRVALKLIAPDLARDDHFRARFKRESKLAAAIEHPNVIPVYEAGEADGHLFIAMRFIDGTDLYKEIHRLGHVDPRRAAQITAQVGDALDAAHKRGLIHRDVKPANVLLADNHAYLTDFGLVKDLAAGGQMTTTGQWVGTPDYVAPELFKGEAVDARVDVYALGCMLFHALTGDVPFPRDTGVAKMWAHSEEEPPKPSEAVPGVPPQLDAVVARAMAKRPDDRYQSAGDLGRAALAAAERREAPTDERTVARGDAAPGGLAPTEPRDDEPTRARQPTPTPTRPSQRPRWVVPAGLAALAIVIVAGVALALGSGGDGKPGTPAVQPDRAGNLGPTPVATIDLGGDIRDVDAGGGALWAAGARGGITRVDARTGHKSAPVRIAARSDKVLYTKSGVFAVGGSNVENEELHKISPATNGEVGEPAPLGTRVLGLALGTGAIWVTASDDNTVQRVDPTTNKLVGKPVRVLKGPYGVAAGKDGIWVTQFGHKPKASEDPGGDVALVFEPVDELDPSFRPYLRVVRTFDAGQKPTAVTYAAGYVWVVSPYGQLTRIDPATKDIVTTHPEEFGFLADLAGDGKRLYLAGLNFNGDKPDDIMVMRIDPKTGLSLGKAVKLGQLPNSSGALVSSAYADGFLWVSAGDFVYKLKP